MLPTLGCNEYPGWKMRPRALTYVQLFDVNIRAIIETKVVLLICWNFRCPRSMSSATEMPLLVDRHAYLNLRAEYFGYDFPRSCTARQKARRLYIPAYS